MKTSELTGPALDWAVAKCEGLTQGLVFGRGAVRVDGLWEKPCVTGGTQEYVLSHDWERLHQECEGPPFFSFTKVWSPSTNWSQGGPIIEREKIGTHCYGRWSACGANMPSSKACEGPTLLIAAMRCYTASKLGDYVDVPEELCQQPKT